jgi:hypothetical protein
MGLLYLSKTFEHEDKGNLDLGSGSVPHTVRDHSKSKKNSLVAGSLYISANSEALGLSLLTGTKDEFLRNSHLEREFL